MTPDEATGLVAELTDGLGADVTVEAVGVPAVVRAVRRPRAPGRPRRQRRACTASRATLHLERLWIRDVTITTGLVDTFSTPKLLSLIEAGLLDARPFTTHRFGLDDALDAYDVFGRAAETNSLKVALSRPRRSAIRVAWADRSRHRTRWRRHDRETHSERFGPGSGSATARHGRGERHLRHAAEELSTELVGAGMVRDARPPALLSERDIVADMALVGYVTTDHVDDGMDESIVDGGAAPDQHSVVEGGGIGACRNADLRGAGDRHGHAGTSAMSDVVLRPIRPSDRRGALGLPRTALAGEPVPPLLLGAPAPPAT